MRMTFGIISPRLRNSLMSRDPQQAELRKAFECLNLAQRALIDAFDSKRSNAEIIAQLAVDVIKLQTAVEELLTL
jgi:hypothetical protein